VIQTPWYIDAIDFDLEQGELNISINFERGSTFNYIDESTGEISDHKAYDKGCGLILM